MHSRRALAVLVWLVSLVVFVSCAAPVAPTLDLTPTSQTLIAGQPLQLTTTRRFPGGGVEDVTTHVTYVSSDRSVATVSDRGVVTAGTNPGTAIIKVFDDVSAATALASVSVIEAQITSIDVSPAVVALTRSSPPRMFAAQARFNNGTTADVTSQVLWSSTNTAVAIVGNSQLDRAIVTAVADGDATIVATDSKTGVTGRSTVFVTGGTVTLEAILVTPNPVTVNVGKTVGITALGVFSDGTTRNLTATATWSSSRPDVATVDPATGVVTGVVAGDATITAAGPDPSAPNGSAKGSAAAKVVP